MTQPRFHNLIVFVIITTASLCVPAHAQEPFSLLSDEQQKRHLEFIANANESELTETTEPSSRLLETVSEYGPIIQINSPHGFDLETPVDFDIIVKPRGNVPVDMESLKVQYKSAFWFPVTKIVKKNATISGDRIFAENVVLLSGSHTLRVSLQDKNGAVTRKIVTFKVN